MPGVCFLVYSALLEGRLWLAVDMTIFHTFANIVALKVSFRVSVILFCVAETKVTAVWRGELDCPTVEA